MKQDTKERNPFMEKRGYKIISLKISLSGVLIAMGVVLSAFYIPFGAAKCFPAQHLINIIAAVLLGPGYAVGGAFIISLIRNMMGLGSLLAFPGSMIGALVAGVLHRRFNNYRLTCLGELAGTGIIGGLIAAPFAMVVMGKEVGMFFFVVPFVLSSLSGSVLAYLLLESTALYQIVMRRQYNRDGE